MLMVYGRYIDEFLCLDDGSLKKEELKGASGVWRIARRMVHFTGRVGDEKIMVEFD